MWLQFDSTTPILFYSGAAFESDKKRALECGAQAYFSETSGMRRPRIGDKASHRPTNSLKPSSSKSYGGLALARAVEVSADNVEITSF